jgi:isoleucyl-tRNA synthetase
VVGGLKVFEANPVVEKALAERGRLWFRSDFQHSYPHCWRCHQPVIFLATEQWFVSFDALRKEAVEAFGTINWHPDWGRERMTGMFEHRPDWCISRQRAWGVPIPAVACQKCWHSMLTPALIEQAAKVFETAGADAWFDQPTEAFLPAGLSCEKCHGSTFERERDILDVWFDSGSSHEAVLAVRSELTWPADLYLEGTDQYRGWFQSSLIVALGTRDRAPYKGVLTHGFVVDEQGRKQSKSLGNVVSPQQVMKDSGADVLRLWVSMVDYRDEVRLGKEVLARTVEAYRKFRNTFRYLLSNLADFDPMKHAVPADRWLDADRYALGVYARLVKQVRAAYDAYDFQTVFKAVNEFVTVDLSAFILDIAKDRVYTFHPDSLDRRSAQTAQYVIADGLTRLLAPILSVTTDEIWERLPGTRDASVHLADFPSLDAGLERALDDLEHGAFGRRWALALSLRAQVNEKIEVARQQKALGKSLEAEVLIGLNAAQIEELKPFGSDLPMLFNTSSVVMQRLSDGLDAPIIEVRPAPGDKCPRCWRIVPDTVASGDLAGLCLRCADAVGGADVGAR